MLPTERTLYKDLHDAFLGKGYGICRSILFTEYDEENRYNLVDVIGKGSFVVVCSTNDTHLGKKVAKKIWHIQT
ncbi:hypothetical protein L1887_38827 [Cichorium endivia]|nr:hypothetical protein L1887_38827 [Cichorium endivia]